MLRIILVGYGELASSLMLGLLESGHEIVGVVRWKKHSSNRLISTIMDFLFPDNFNTFLKMNHIPTMAVSCVNSKKFREQAAKLKPDIILVGTWGEILKKETIELPKIACINCHPSLLPAHRGSNPYTSVLRNGETKTGITFHLIDEGIDTGPILLQKEIVISDNDNGKSLKSKCAYKAKEAVIELMTGLQNAKLLPKKQDEAKASYYAGITENDAKINWNKSAEFIHNQIRGLYPWLDCYSSHKNQFLMIKSSKIITINNQTAKPGMIIEKTGNNLIISTADPDKAILTDKVRVYGFLSTIWSDFYLSNNVKIGDSLN